MNSKYRQLLFNANPSSSYFDLSAADFASSTAGEAVAASGRYVAYACAALGDVGVIPIKSVGKRIATNVTILKGHGATGPVLDVSFSSLNYSLLATGASDNTTKIWRLPETPEEVLTVPTYAPTASLASTGSRNVVQTKWHPSAENVLASSAGSSTKFWDVSAERETLVFDCSGADVCSSAWDATNGARIAFATPSDKKMRVVDPRSRESSEIENLHPGNGKSVALEWGMNDYTIFSTGSSASRDRELAIWDLRNSAAGPVSRTRIDSNTGHLRPMLDHDTHLLFLMGHGDSNIRIYEAEDGSSSGRDASAKKRSSSPPGPLELQPINNVTFSEPAKGYALVPKAALDVMGCEVDRVLRLLKNSVEAVRAEVPRRKAYRDFQEDIFPLTRAPKPAMTASEYFNENKDAAPVMVSPKELAAIHSTSEETVSRATEEIAEVKAVDDERAERERREVERLAEQHANLDARFSKMLGYSAKMKFAKVTQAPNKDKTWHALTPEVGSSDSTTFCVNHDFFAVPWKGGGGPIYIGDLTKPGKLMNIGDVPVLNGHSGPVSALAFDEFDGNLLLSGSEDCTVKLWSLGGIAEKGLSALPSVTPLSFSGSHRLSVRGVGYHPVARGVAHSFSAHPDLKIWDYETGSLLCEYEGESAFENSAVSSVDWSYDGSRVLSTHRDSHVRLGDPRVSPKAVQNKFHAHDGLKGIRGIFLGSSPIILTTGFGKTGDRQFRLWDERKFLGRTGEATPLSTTALDAGAGVIQPYYVEDNGVVILTAKGELTVRMFEIEGLSMAVERPEIGRTKRELDMYAVHRCAEYRASGDASQSIAFLPRRFCNIATFEWLVGYRLTATFVESLSFTVPRSVEVSKYFADDIYPPARSNEPAIGSAKAWREGAKAPPKRVSLNKANLTPFSQRPQEEATASMKRGIEMADKRRQQVEKEEEEKRKKNAEMDRLQRLAAQHADYNHPSMSGAHGDPANKSKLVMEDTKGGDDKGNEVAEDEW